MLEIVSGGDSLHAKSLVLLTVMFSGCSGDGVNSSDNLDPQGASQALPGTAVSSEKLDAIYSNNRITAQVVSSGCTKADHFSVNHQVSDNSCLLTIIRDTADYCKRAAFVMGIDFEWPLVEACQSREIVFANQPLTDD